MRTNKNGVNKDQKDKVKKDGYNRGQHCVYCLTYHMIFVTHYRKPVINDEMSAAMKEFSNHIPDTTTTAAITVKNLFLISTSLLFQVYYKIFLTKQSTRGLALFSQA